MTYAMLWWCDTGDLKTDIEAAAVYHKKKYGRAPELCLVHPDEMQKVNIPGIAVRPWRAVLPKHLHIGIEEMPTAPAETS